jgi:AcrR family transcriptional regulator
MRRNQATASLAEPGDVRQRVLDCASDLFYREGVRAVGVDLIVERAGVAKTTLYRYFPTKDDLVAAFLQAEDAHFWSCWDAAAARGAGDARAELNAQLEWIAERLTRPNYRGCPQINVSAEFPDEDHPARRVAAAHKNDLRSRFTELARRMRARDPEMLGLQLALLVNGGFSSSSIVKPAEALRVLAEAADALLVAHGVKAEARKRR